MPDHFRFILGMTDDDAETLPSAHPAFTHPFTIPSRNRGASTEPRFVNYHADGSGALSTVPEPLSDDEVEQVSKIHHLLTDPVLTRILLENEELELKWTKLHSDLMHNNFKPLKYVVDDLKCLGLSGYVQGQGRLTKKICSTALVEWVSETVFVALTYELRHSC